jgi:hypothetical protein
MISVILTLVCGLASSGLWQVDLQNGSNLKGELRAWNEGELILSVDGQEQSIALTDVKQLTAVGAGDEVSPAVADRQHQVVLLDGSMLAAAQFTMKDGQATIERGEGDAITVPGQQIRSVRFGPRRADQDAQWNELVSESRDTDAVVVVKSTGALDYASGIIQGVTAEAVQFEFGNRTVDLPRARLAGFLLARAATTLASRPPFVIELHSGDRWHVKTLAGTANQLQGTSLAGVDSSWPWNSIRRIALQVGTFQYLSDLEPLEESWQPRMAENPSLADDVSFLFRLQRDRATGLMGELLVVRAGGDRGKLQEFERGLSIHSGSEVTYRLGRKYQRLTAVVGIDPRAAEPGDVLLSVFADDRQLLDESIGGAEPGRMIDLDVAGANRLRIVVDYGDANDQGDYLNLCDAKLWE